jgi:hypothetical protein
VSLSCGSLWFIDAGRVSFIETAISPRYLSHDDRIEIADGLARGELVKLIAARIGKSFKRLPRDRSQPQAQWPLPALVCAQPRLPSAAATQAAPVQRRCRVGSHRGRQADKALVTGPDQPVAAAPLPAAPLPAASFLAGVYRDHL